MEIAERLIGLCKIILIYGTPLIDHIISPEIMAVGKPRRGINLAQGSLCLSARIDYELLIARNAACRHERGQFRSIFSGDRLEQGNIVIRRRMVTEQERIAFLRVESVQERLFMVIALFIGEIRLLNDRISVESHGPVRRFCGQQLICRNRSEVRDIRRFELLHDLPAGL